MQHLCKANDILVASQHFRQDQQRWATFEQFMTLQVQQTVDTTSPDHVISFLMKMSQQGNKTTQMHFPNCTRNAPCDCPFLGSISTVLTYKRAIKCGLELHQFRNAADTAKVKSFVTALKFLARKNRVEPKQAVKLPRARIVKTFRDLTWFLATTSEKSNWFVHRNLVICQMMAIFAMRVSDVLALRRSDIISSSLEVLKIKMSVSKNFKIGESSTVLLHKDKDDIMLLPHLDSWLKRLLTQGSETGYLFPYDYKLTSQMKSVNPRVINDFLKVHFGKDVTTHSFRVSLACKTRAESLSLPEVASTLRVKSLSTAARYSKKFTDFLDK